MSAPQKISYTNGGEQDATKLQPCENVLASGNFAAFSQLHVLAAYSTLDYTGSPLAAKGTWHLLPTTPAMLPTAGKHFDRVALIDSLAVVLHKLCIYSKCCVLSTQAGVCLMVCGFKKEEQRFLASTKLVSKNELKGSEKHH